MIQSHVLKYYINKQRVGNPNKHNVYCCYFTDFTRFPNYEETIVNLPKKSLIIYREYKLNPQKRQELALKIQKIARKFNHQLIIAKDFKLAKRIKADGYHFSDHDHRNSKKHAQNLINHKRLNKDFIITLACHELTSVKKAQNSNIDLLFFSPIFPTNSHPNAKTKGVFKLNQAKAASRQPVFALGGVGDRNLGKIKSGGVAGIGMFNSALEFSL